MLDIYVGDKRVAKLENPVGDKHALTYLQTANANDFVSLLMPVQTPSWIWEKGLHPFFQMNLPEGFLLSILRDMIGSALDGRDITLLGVVGRNAIGRVRAVPEGEALEEPTDPFDINEILKEKNSEEKFISLIRRFARSGISGVVPKFLDPVKADRDANFLKATVQTNRHIVKGFAAHLPGVAINEWISLRAAQRAGLNAANATLSEDGQALVVDRFDIDSRTNHRFGMEDACSLLGLRPQNKYDSTWERVANRMSEVIPAADRRLELEKLGRLIVFCLMTRNADCHTKNVAVMYDNANDVRLTPAFDLFTTSVYDVARYNNFSMSIGGTKSWTPGKKLQSFAATSLQLEPRQLQSILEQTAQALLDTAPGVIELCRKYTHFEQVGKRMLGAWKEGIDGLLLEKSPAAKFSKMLEESRFSAPQPQERKSRVLGGSTMLRHKDGG